MSNTAFWKQSGLVIVAALVVNVIVYAAASLAGVELLVPMGAMPAPLNVGAVVVFTALPLAIAAVLLLLATRRGISSEGLFVGVIVVVGVLSLTAPLSADLATTNKLVLAAMHVVAAGAALIGVRSLARAAAGDAR